MLLNRLHNSLSKNIRVIVDLQNLTIWMYNSFSSLLPHTDKTELEELIETIKRSLLGALVCWVKQNRDPKVGNYNEWLHQAIDLLENSGVALELAASVIHQAETIMTQSIINYFPNVDDTGIMTIIYHELLKDGNICLIVKIK